MAAFDTIGEWAEAIPLATAFLLCGSIVSKVPYDKVGEVRTKNRRLGLGLMGLAEWLAVRGYRYEPNEALAEWLKAYSKSGEYAEYYADLLGVSYPVKTRAVAPAGTISIIAETTSGLEPIYTVAYKRRYQSDNQWKYQYVIDESAQRLIDKGVNPDSIETSMDLARDPERRIQMQAYTRYVTP